MLSLLYSVLTIIFIFLVIFFYRKLLIVNRHLSDLEKKASNVEEQMKNRGIRLVDPSKIGDGMRVTIEVKDPIKLAKEKSFIGKLIGDMAPALIKKRVYEEVQKEAILELKKQNVESKVDIVNL